MSSIRMEWHGAMRALLLVAGALLGSNCLAVGTTASKTVLVSSPASPYAMQSVTLTATVAPSSGSGATPTGTVTFKDGATAIPAATCPGTLNASGVAICTISFATAATHSLTANYAGDATYAISSGALSEVVQAQVVTTTTLTSGTNPSAPNASVTLTANVTGSNPSSNVTFYDGATSLGAVAVSAGVATKGVTFTTNGSHTLKAVYAGDTVNATSTSSNLTQSVKSASTIVLANSPATAYQSQNVVLTATVMGVSPTGPVTFNDTTVGSTASWGPVNLSSGKATVNATFTTVGTHTLTAAYAGDAGNYDITSSVINEVVNAKYTTTSTVSAATSTPQIGVPVTLSSTVTSSGSGIKPTGSVTFKDGTATACTGTVSSSTGVATCAWTPTAQGARSVTAVYNGDTPNLGSTSSALTETVGINSGTLTLASSANPSSAGSSLTLTASVGGYLPTGSVQFKDGVANLGSAVPVVSGQASMSTTPTAASGHVYSASYSGDPNNTGRTGSVTVNVIGANSATAISASASAATPATSVTFTATVSGSTPTGSVTFRDGATVLHNSTVATGTATWSQTLANGLHVVTATYGGDTTNAASTSTATLVQVSAAGDVQPPAAALQTNYEYDAQGNLTKVTDANAAATQQAYDSLERATTITQPVPAVGQPAPTIGLSYDLQDQPATVTDPRHLATTYTIDGLGNATGLASPDTGATNRTFYDSGLLKTSTDARGKVSTYTYDALDRLKTVSYSDGGPGILFNYDGGVNGVGHLTSFADESGSTSLFYDGFGRLVNQTQASGPSGGQQRFVLIYTWGTTGTATGKLLKLTYPSGANVTYGYDAAGRINDVSVTGADGTVRKILTGLRYTAHGQPGDWAWGDATTYRRVFDAYGRLVSYPLGNPNGAGASAGVVRTLVFDAAGRIVGYSHSTAPNWDQVFAYDGLDRLTGATLNGGNTYGYAYDATGNRTQTTINGAPYASTVSANSNWYTNVASAAGGATAQGYDLSGHLTSDAGGTYTYSGRGRLKTEFRSGNTFSYLYNALEQRVYKAGPTSVVSTGKAYYVYDEAGHLIGEYDSTGKAIYETVYLGDMPVAALTAPAIGQTTVSYVYADHLNTARVIVRPGDQAIVWQWGSNEPFGQSQANSNPNGLGVYTYNPRFPGQVADAESGWFYNGHRDYDPSQGRYKQSDPIGLRGGINTFGYVANDPLSRIDPHGLAMSCKVIFWMLIANLEECREDGTTPSEQDAKDAVRMNDRQLQKACKANGYEDAHALKKDFGLDSKSDIFSDKNGNMYSGPRQGTGTPQYLHMNTSGTPVSAPPPPAGP